MKPNPRPVPTSLASLYSITNIDNYKKVLCVSYNYCLNYAAKQRWPNFHCNECASYIPVSPEKLLQEAMQTKQQLFNFDDF